MGMLNLALFGYQSNRIFFMQSIIAEDLIMSGQIVFCMRGLVR